jgi:peptidoglycan/LPS O-acetylase OafA/YrhL
LRAHISTDSSARLPSLDGARGLLALVVLLAHFAALAGYPQGLTFAKLSVLGFFLISAYALTVSWREGYAAFLAKRFVRLWPAYAVAMAVGVRLTGLALPWHDYFWIPFRPANDYFPQDPVVWSLYTEVYAGLAMPLFVFAGRRHATALAACAALGALAFWRSDFGLGLFFVLGAWAAPRWRFNFAWLNSAVPQALGRISYSLYLIHTAVLVYCRHFAPEIWLVIALPLAMGVATLFYATIEAPSVTASRWVGRMRLQSAVGSRRITNSIWPSASSRQNSISVR